MSNTKTTFDFSSIKYHRNGIDGEGFFVLKCNCNKDLILTITTTEKDEKEYLNYNNCRVINPKDLADCWRGDRIAYDLEKELEAKKTNLTNLAFPHFT